MSSPSAPFTSTILITGGSTGLGYSLALALSASEPSTQIVICSRSGASAADTINQTTGNNNVVYLPLDLATHEQTRTFVDLYRARKFPPIRALVLNAGLQFIDKLHLSADGLEMMFAVNHVNSALLFFLLRDQLTLTARVILVSSSTHDPKLRNALSKDYKYTSAEAIAHPPNGPAYDTSNAGLFRYAESKLCNVLFAYALDRHARARGAGTAAGGKKEWTIMALDPGVMATQLYRAWPGLLGSFFNWFLRSWFSKYLLSDMFTTEYVAETVAKLAVDKEFEGEEKSGKYYQVIGAKAFPSSVASYDEKAQEDLWEWTIKEVARDEAERKAFGGLE